MTLDPQALAAAAEAEARYDGYDDLLSFSKTMRERYIDRTRAAILAYLETAHPPKTVKLTREDERLLEQALAASTTTLYPILPADAGWQGISTAPSLERVLVAGWQPRHGNTAGYWWYYEDVTGLTGVPEEHPDAKLWMPWPKPPVTPPDSEYEVTP